MSHDSGIPSWIKAELFTKVLQKSVPHFKGIKSFKVSQALAPGENYATVMLKVHIECQLQNGRAEKETFMLKVPHDNELYRTELVKWQMFETEAGMYRQIVPNFEQLYRSKGVEIRFGANAYELPVKDEYILLEDLSKRGFRNVKRQDCLDMEHCQAVLKKMAQFHAASAVWVEQNGPFPPLYQNGMIHDKAEGILGPMLTDGLKYVLEAAKDLDKKKEYYADLEQFSPHFFKVFFETSQRKDNDFKVLNHGDCWSNNIMFQYNEKGHVQETYFVDLQLPRYGTPAQDLLYFILSSTQLDVKINRFDEMIRYYYDNLTDHLKLLEYRKPLPCLRDLHQMIIKSNIWGMVTVITTMAAVLCDHTDTATIDNFAGDNQETQEFKRLLYLNDRFKKHAAIVLPWLRNRGALEISFS